jgi:N-acyl-D-amino-acid deacylase
MVRCTRLRLTTVPPPRSRDAGVDGAPPACECERVFAIFGCPRRNGRVMDLLLRGASLVDGTGAPARPADVAVDGERITGVASPGRLTPTHGTEVIDLDGLVLAPGFIDIHTHYDAQILWDGDLTPVELARGDQRHHGQLRLRGRPDPSGAPGHHRADPRERRGHVDGGAQRRHRLVLRDVPEVPGRAINARQAAQRGRVPWAHPLRLFVLGGEERAATPTRWRRCGSLLREAIEPARSASPPRASQITQGAFGRPVPSRFAEVDEVYGLAAVLGRLGKGIMQISIGPGCS